MHLLTFLHKLPPIPSLLRVHPSPPPPSTPPLPTDYYLHNPQLVCPFQLENWQRKYQKKFYIYYLLKVFINIFRRVVRMDLTISILIL